MTPRRPLLPVLAPRSGSGVPDRGARTLALVAAVALLATGIVAAHADPKRPAPKEAAVYLVGGAARSINPPAEMIAAGNFFLGGYGLGSGRLASRPELQTPASLDGPKIQ